MALCPCDLYLSFSPLGCRLATSSQSSHLPGNTTLEGAEETKRLRIDHRQSGWIKNDWSHLHTFHTCMGVSQYKWHPCSRPLRQGDLDLDEHMTAVCKTEGESPVAVVPRRKWGSETVWSGKLGTICWRPEWRITAVNVQHYYLWPPVNSEISSRMINNLISESPTLAMFGTSLILLYQNT